MKLPLDGAIDCDAHMSVPNVAALLPFMSDYWRDQIVNRYIDRSGFNLMSYPPRSPLTVREDWRSAPDTDGLEVLRRNLLDPFRLSTAICHTLHGSIALFNEDMGAEFCKAVNSWVARERLDREPRLRASILVHAQNPALAVEEIERCAEDPRFVAVLLPVMGDNPLGRRIYWPIYEACERYGLSLAVHAGSTYRHAPTAAGWTSFQSEDYVLQSSAFENLIVSFLAEGVFQKFQDLKLICMESGFTWLPTLIWRSSKTWRGVRTEVPWLDRVPSEIIRERIRLTLQPVDAPRDPKILNRILEQIACDDMLLFSTDYPHSQFDGEDALPDGLSDDLIRKITIDNPLAAFPRLASAQANRIAGQKSKQETVQ
jgi:predicted TIM-barrel fold metal-dependent hydrolase